MRSSSSNGVWPFRQPYAWLLFLTLAVTAFNCIYVYFGVPFSPVAEFFSVYAVPFAILFWVVWDAQSRRCTPCYDFGLMVYLGWFLALPGYLIWTRGWRGLLLLFGFFLLVLIPIIFADIAWNARWGRM